MNLKKSLAFNTGLLWHIVPSRQWAGEAAAEMYSDPSKAALEKAWPVVVLMGRFGGEGKSFFSVFGFDNVQDSPAPGSFPLLGLEKKLVRLGERAFDTSVLPLPTQLLWYEGKAPPITRQTQAFICCAKARPQSL